jgi:hypothetical protein
MTKEYYAHSLPGRQKCKKFKLFQRFERLERSFMEECGGNGEGFAESFGAGEWLGF